MEPFGPSRCLTKRLAAVPTDLVLNVAKYPYTRIPRKFDLNTERTQCQVLRNRDAS